MSEVRVFVICNRAYDEGIDHGDWVDCNQDEMAIDAGIDAILESSPMYSADDYSWSISEYDGFDEIDLGETPDISILSDVGQFIAENRGAGLVWLKAQGNSNIPSLNLKEFSDSYCGFYRSMAEYAEEYYENVAPLPAWAVPHIDWESVANDLLNEGYWIGDYVNGVFVFCD